MDTFLSPNIGGYRTETRGVIVHSTRSGSTAPDRLQREYQATVAWMVRDDLPETRRVSAHRVIGYEPSQYAQLVPDDRIAWHAEEDNASYLGIELCQPLPEDPFSDWQVDVAAAVIRLWAAYYGFPLDDKHILRHQDTPQGRRNGKTDPGPKLDWTDFPARLKTDEGRKTDAIALFVEGIDDFKATHGVVRYLETFAPDVALVWTREAATRFQRVLIVGNNVSVIDAEALMAAGCHVRRYAGRTIGETADRLHALANKGLTGFEAKVL